MESTIRIERYADQGRCVGHIDGRVVFVRFALPGELVRVVLDEPHDREDRFWTGEVTEVLEASEDRVEPVWPLAGPLAMGGGVGGADLVHVSLPGQLKWKSMSIAEQMRRLGHVDVDVPIERMPEDEAEQGLHWRTRIEMIADENGRPSMRRRGTHVRVPIDTMPLASRALLNAAEKEHVWDGGFTPGSQIRLSVPEPRGNAEIADNYAVLVDGEVTAGNRELTEKVTVCGREFEYGVDAGGFWQMHRHAPIALTGHVMSLVHGELDGAASACLWDLYSGSGLFTLPLATLSAGRTRMLSVEGGKTAVKHAQRNLRAIHLGNVDARVGDVAKTLANVRNDLAKPDIVVLDPPRAGARAKVCRQIAESGARSVVYIACDPASLARDTATLASLVYDLADIRAFDIYPTTHHVETVALFRKATR
ncbi:RNA methyltransferase [Bifidobacterium adolescentis]|uniref:class I SAM-dependent RNA methyltransferase n=1 Tax=Bifidobacterium adolescentis TaxID=1680 RepID=UPI0005554B1B|nr:RsmD family RNA methyltransferase [Bifidobacterium adolescentis]OSH03098.1 RNA methyltransferase [Bifidobacterium adolescentis]